MKKNILTFFLAAALLTAVGAVADEGVPDAPDQLVMTGTVVNASPDELVLETESGNEIFLMDKEDLYPEPILEGTTVTVWFTERAGHHYATKLMVGNHTHGVADTVVDLDADLDAEVHTHVEPADPEVHIHAEADLDTDLDTDIDTEVETTTAYDTTYERDTRYNRLPQTASNHLLLALLGLIGLSGAAIVWQLRK